MKEKEYLEERLGDQLIYYSRKSEWNQRCYRVLKIVTIASAALIPLLAGTLPCDSISPGLTTGILGVLIAFSEGAITLYKFKDNWIEYRITLEMLKHERVLFLTKSKPYRNADESKVFKLFVSRVEELLTRESARWKQNAMNDEDKPITIEG